MFRGFSIIEMLVAVAIIAVLLAITMPALAQARAAGRRTVCSSNLRTLGLGLQTYMDEGDGLLPRADWVVDLADGRKAPFDLVSEQIEVSLPVVDPDGSFVRMQPWACPSDRSLDLGISYLYAPTSVFQLFLEEEHPRRMVTSLFSAHTTSVLFLDAMSWHGREQWSGRNGVHWDGSVGPLDAQTGLGFSD